jgi:hypothetical protein
MNAETIPDNVVRIIREEQNRLDRTRRFMFQPLSQVIERLARSEGSVTRLVQDLKGRYIATFEDSRGCSQFCCAGHKSTLYMRRCVKRQRAVLSDIYARVPGIGLFVVEGSAWRPLVNRLEEYPKSEQMKTIGARTGKGQAA